MIYLSIGFFIKIFIISFSISLIFFGLSSEAGLGLLLKLFALSLGFSILIAFLYPSIRGIQKGDRVSVVPTSVIPSIFGKGGIAMGQGKVNSEIRIKLEDGREAVGVIESYEGFMSLPKVRLVYEERLVDQ